jgi:hypothetical protein
MHRTRKRFLAVIRQTNVSIVALISALLVGVPTASLADVVFLKSGSKMEGRIVERTETSVEIDIGSGSLTLPMSSVDHIEEGGSVLDEIDERAKALSSDDLDGWLELARFASREGLGAQSRWAYEHVLELDPNDAEANRALGRVEIDGRWMTEDEAYRARGYVNFEGEWMTPAQQDAILRSREADQAAAQADAQRAEAEARQADAQAREAEARARQAEAQAVRSASRNPLYWGGWGPGPRDWPSNPLDRPGDWSSEKQP